MAETAQQAPELKIPEPGENFRKIAAFLGLDWENPKKTADCVASARNDFGKVLGWVGGFFEQPNYATA